MRRVGNTLAALAYVSFRVLLARIRRFLRNPVAVVIAVLALIGIGAASIFGTGELPEIGTNLEDRQVLVAIVSGFLLTICWSAVAHSPVRLRGADLAWLVPRPGAERGLVIWHLVNFPARILILGSIGMGIVGLTGGGTAWPTLVAIALMYTLARAVPALIHLISLRISPRAVSLVTRLVLVAVAGSALLAAVYPDRLPGPLDRLTSPVRHLLDTLIGAVFAPEAAGDIWVVAAITAVIVVAAITLGTGYTEAAARRTWEHEAVTAAVQDGSMTGEVMAEAIARQVRKGIPSLDRDFGMRGEWALTWRSLAAWRRTWRPIGIVAGALFVGAVALAFWAPQAAGLPVGIIVGVSVMMPQTGMIEESDHVALYRIPGRPFLKVVAVDAIPVAVTTLVVALLALPRMLVSGTTIGTLLVGVFALPLIAAAVISVGGAACLWGKTVSRRIGLSMLGGISTAIILTISAVIAAVAGATPLVGPLVVAPFIAAGAWWAAASMIRV